MWETGELTAPCVGRRCGFSLGPSPSPSSVCAVFSSASRGRTDTTIPITHHTCLPHLGFLLRAAPLDVWTPSVECSPRTPRPLSLSVGLTRLRTLGLPELLQQEVGLLLDPVLIALFPHPIVPEGGQGEPPSVLPGGSVVENDP